MNKERETRVVMVEAPSVSPNDGIDLGELLRLLLRAWKLISGVTVLVTAAAVVYALIAPEIYKAEILLTLTEEEQSHISSALGQFGGLASLAGVSIPSDSNKEQVLATLESRKFIGMFLSEQNLAPDLFEDQWDKAKESWRVAPGEEPPTGETGTADSPN